MPFKALILLFAAYAIYKLFLKYRESELRTFTLFVWLFIWIGVGVVVVVPWTSDKIAAFLGFQKGVDFVVYIVVLALVYAVFRIMIKFEHMEFEMTKFVRSQAIEEFKNTYRHSKHQ